uniref:Cytohesin-3 n=1 Tax=Hydatigena taeniaeformis TaxID=6205 RepID=A0A0R3X221_HYDTA
LQVCYLKYHLTPLDCLGDVNERLQAIRNQRLETIKNIQRLKSEYEHVTRLLEEAGVSPEGELDARRNLGKRKFCSNPKMGLEFLFENHIIERDPAAVARFFVDEKRNLSKAAIGSYLGEISKEFNMQVLEEYLKLHEFSGQDFLPALRNFLFSFQLPGESQKIDKILLSFAHQYVLQNPSAFHTSQDAYVLAYAAILLNTTLHNTNAKSQNLSLADEKTFIQTMLDFDKETNLSEEMIRSVYHGIKSKPIQLAEECSEPSIMRGWLWKLGGRVKIWKRRWFVLTEEYLFYYNAPDRTTQRKGIVALENVCIRRVSNDRSREFCFELFPRPCPNNNTNGVVGSASSNGNLGGGGGTINTRKADREGVITTDYHTTYRMAATNSEEYEKWVTSLQLITNRFGIAAAAAASSVNRRSETPLRGASVPCLSGSSSSTTSSALIGAPGLPSVASQPNPITSVSGSPEI